MRRAGGQRVDGKRPGSEAAGGWWVGGCRSSRDEHSEENGRSHR